MDVIDIRALRNFSSDAIRNTYQIDKGREGERVDTEGNLFDSVLDSAIKNISQTNAYLSDAENEKIRFALGEVDNTHDMTIAMQKTSEALQYTVAVRDKFLEAYRELIDSGELTVRVHEQCNLGGADALKDFIDRGGMACKQDDFFSSGTVKILGDGSLGSRTARLSVEYPGTDEKGILIFSDDEMREQICTAASNGKNAVVHAIGDGCLDQVLDAFEYARNKYPGERRDGIVHCQVSREDQLKRIADLGLCVYAQSVFLDYDNHIVEALVPAEIASTSYSWKTLLGLGVNVSNGSDCPVEFPDVLKGIQCAVTRTSMDGTGPYLPDQAFTVREAIDSFTSASAYASSEECIKGSIAPGMLADFTVLGSDPFSEEPFSLSRIEVKSTWVGGRRVF